MVRTLEGKARAFLSDRYRILDHYEILEAVLPVVGEMGEGVNIVSTEITDNRIYLKVINKRLELEVQKGDAVQAGFMISNSEIGMGAVKVEPLIYRLVCLKVASKTFNLNQGESDGVLNHLIRGGDLSAYGLLNAITRTAQDVESYDRSTELEAIGSKVLALPKSTWREIALAK